MDYAIGPAPKGGDHNRGSEILAVDGVIFGQISQQHLPKQVSLTPKST